MTAIIHGLPKPLPAERVVAVEPVIAPAVPTSWRARTNFFTGRALSARALQTEQQQRGGQLAAIGQLLSPGIVAGLEVKLEDVAGVATLEVAPGVGVAADGEDVRLTRPLRVPLDALPVMLTRAGTETRTLGQWRTEPSVMPLAVILVLAPIETTRDAQLDATSPCELDPRDGAFDDEQRVDGLQLLALDATPDITVPALNPVGQSAATWRNRLAYAFFEAEARRESGVMPWEEHAVGIACIGLSAIGAPAFIDVHTVARNGGELNRRPVLPQTPGTRRLWQARLRQFTDQLAASDFAQLASQGLSSQFHFLPPVGVLPAGSVEVRGGGEPHLPLPRDSELLPNGFVVEAASVELEALDDFLRASASLTPFTTDQPEQLQLLVPVPQQHFSPDLLRVEDETPDEFREAIRLFLLRLNHRLGRRALVRGREAALQGELFGEARTPAYPDHDADAVPGEVALNFPEDDQLPEREIKPPPENLGEPLEPPLRGLGKRMAELCSPTAFAVLLWQLQRDTNAPVGARPRALGEDAAVNDWILFLSTSGKGVGLLGFVEDGSKKLLSASERLDVAFARLAGELFRVRSLASGETAATQLATSPALPFIQKGRIGEVGSQQLIQFKSFLTTPKPVLTSPIDRNRPLVISQSVGLPAADDVSPAVLFSRSVRERLESPLVLFSKDGATRAKRAAFRTIVALHNSGLGLDGLMFTGFRVSYAGMSSTDADVPANVPLPEVVPPNGTVFQAKRVDIFWVERFLQFFDQFGFWPHDPAVEEDHQTNEGSGEDEGSLMATAIRSLEEGIAALRTAEGRLAGFDRSLGLARDRLALDLASFKAVTRRLAELDEEIAEFRKDVRIARALETEEIARARRVNEERRQIIAKHVPFLVFRRPRTTEGLLPAPARPVQPAVNEQVIPACLRADFENPEQLRAMVDLLREAPVLWSPFAAKLLPRINRWYALREVVSVALMRAANPGVQSYDPYASAAFDDPIGARVRDIFARQKLAIANLRAERLRFDYAYYLRFSWAGLVTEAAPVATLNDLLLAAHGRQEVSDAVARHLSDINRATACLFERMRAVAPFTRLAWVELLSEAVTPVDLRRLSVLPSWESVDPSDKRTMQTIVTWLYAQIAGQLPGALNFMHDLVRVTIVLSGHAAVNQLLAAATLQPHPVLAGDRIDLAIESQRLRVGMQVALYEAEGLVPAVARGIVEDLGAGIATVRVVSTENDRSVLPLRAQVTEPDRNASVAIATGERTAVGALSHNL